MTSVMTTSLFEAASFEGLPPPGPVKGWSTWKGDVLHSTSLHPDKSDLLIGHDIMWLIGIDNCEKLLAEQHGILCQPTIVEISSDRATCWGVTVQGRLLAGMLSWSVCCPYEPDRKNPLFKPSADHALASAAGYLGGLAEDSRDNKTYTDLMKPGVRLRLSDSDTRSLKRWSWSTGWSKRDRKLVEVAAREVLTNLQVEVVHLRYRVIPLCEVPAETAVLDPQFVAKAHQNERYREGLARISAAVPPSAQKVKETSHAAQ